MGGAGCRSEAPQAQPSPEQAHADHEHRQEPRPQSLAEIVRSLSLPPRSLGASLSLMTCVVRSHDSSLLVEPRARHGQLSPPVAYLTAASVIGLAVLASGTPSPLYGIYSSLWGLSPAAVTGIYAIYALGVLLSLLAAGRVSDEVGRKPVLLVAVSGIGASTVLYMLAASAVWLVAARLLQGVATGLALSTTSAALLDLHPPPRRCSDGNRQWRRLSRRQRRGAPGLFVRRSVPTGAAGTSLRVPRRPAVRHRPPDAPTSRTPTATSWHTAAADSSMAERSGANSVCLRACRTGSAVVLVDQWTLSVAGS